MPTLEWRRSRLFGGKFSAPQVQGLNAILDVWERDYAAKDDRWLAYALATTYHETAFTMGPIHEKRGPKYFFSRYDKDGDRPGEAWQYREGRRRSLSRARLRSADRPWQLWQGQDARGRGFGGHARLGLGSGHRRQNSLAGMETGLFTSKKFGDYFNKTAEDWLNARKIINGLDCAPQIADHGKRFYGAISYTTGA
jgi:putative chitinase